MLRDPPVIRAVSPDDPEFVPLIRADGSHIEDPLTIGGPSEVDVSMEALDQCLQICSLAVDGHEARTGLEQDPLPIR
jgi:hypothetical protein